jgi:ABC-type nickel/cobalt efflux system permease component RcnA
MRRALIFLGLPLAVALGLWWLAGGFDGVLRAAVAAQRQAQEALAGAVRAIRAGEPGAMLGLLGVCFSYGVLHAVGPGHGKALIGAYGLARRVPVLRLSVLALVASLAQAAVAVALVYGAVAVLGLTREAATGLAEGAVPALGNLLIAGLGLWLLWRGIAGLRRRWAAGQGHHGHDHGHHHGHHHAEDCGCGHAHGPTVAQVEALTGWRDTALLVAGIAMRPCSGALFLLILTWQLGIGGAGVAGAFAMGAGVALVTMAAAALAAWAREGAFAGLSGGALARAVPLAEVVFGAVILAAGLVLFWRGI